MRRLPALLALFTAASLWTSACAAAPISVLYKKDAATSADRVDTAVQSAMQEFEERLIDAGYEVIQPEQKMYDILDKAGPNVVVTFSPDAGWSLVLSMEKQTRPYPNAANQFFAETRVRARVFSGRRVLASFAEAGQVGFRPGNEDKAFEAAARKVVTQLADRLDERLKKAPPPEAPPPPASAADGPQFVPSTGTLPRPKQKWALLFGVSDFSNVSRLSGARVNSLPGVTKDMVEMEELLGKSGVPKERRIVLYNDKATSGALRQALADLRQKAAPDDVVMLYISSHGMPKQEGLAGLGYPLTWDTRIGDKASIIDFEEIRESLAALPARQVLWIADTCHSGGAALGLPSVEFSRRNFVVSQVHGLSPQLGADVAGKDLAVMTSSRADQPSIDDNATGHGLFTYHLLRALQASADKDTSYQMFKKYVEPGVTDAARKMREVQQPGFGRIGKGDLIVF